MDLMESWLRSPALFQTSTMIVLWARHKPFVAHIFEEPTKSLHFPTLLIAATAMADLQMVAHIQYDCPTSISSQCQPEGIISCCEMHTYMYHVGLHERLERIRNFHPENLADLHPRLGERMARNSEEVRSRLEEARRMTVEDMRNLQK